MKNLRQRLSPNVRWNLYIFFGIASQFVAYAGWKDWIGKDELALWSQLGTVTGFGAAAKVRRRKRGRHRA